MQRVQQWDLDKKQHVYSLQALKIFFSVCPTAEIIGSTQAALLSLFHPLQNSLFRTISKCYHNITLTTDNTKLGDMAGMLNGSTTTSGTSRNSRTVPTETS